MEAQKQEDLLVYSPLPTYKSACWGLTAKGKCLPEMRDPNSEILDSSVIGIDSNGTVAIKLIFNISGAFL